jgi:alpha-L-rhamnosidase
LNVVGRPVFTARLILEYPGGKKDIILTDNTWKFSYGPILKNNVYPGEVYDSWKEIKDWDKPRFDDSGWQSAIKKEEPGGKLQQAFFPPVQVTDTIIPVDIYSPEDGIYIADMGVNFAGVHKIRLKEEPDDSVVFRFGKRIFEDSTLNPMTSVF